MVRCQGFLKVEAKVLYPQIYWQEHPVQVSADDLLKQIAQILKAEFEIFGSNQFDTVFFKASFAFKFIFNAQSI